MGATFQGVGKLGSGCLDLGKNIHGGGTGGPDVWVGDIGDDITHWEGGGKISPQGALQADKMATLEGGGGGVSPAGGRDGGGGVTGVVNLRLPFP